MDNEEMVAIHQRLFELRQEHRDMDDAIHSLSTQPSTNQLQINRMKKRKLMLRDLIAKLESRLIPDLNA